MAQPPGSTPSPLGGTGQPVPPRGRPAPLGYDPRTASLQRRAELREYGAKVLAATGGERAMGEIARLAKMRPAALTNFYARKHDLTYDILHAHIDGLAEHVGGADDALHDADPLSHLTGMVLGYLDYVLSYRNEQRVAITLLDILPAPQRDPLRYQLRLLAHRLVVAIEAAAPELGNAPVLRFPVALNLMAMMNAAVLWFREDGALSRQEIAQLLARQTVAGVHSMVGGPAGDRLPETTTYDVDGESLPATTPALAG